jgi:hypothetical protein
VDVLPVSYAFSFRIRKSLPQTGEDAASCVDLAEAFPGDAEVAFGFAAAFGGWVADGGSDEAFALQPLQGRIDAANGNIAAAMAFELAGDRHAVGLVAEMDDGEQNHEFEFPEIAAVCHYFNNSEEIDDVKSNLYLSEMRTIHSSGSHVQLSECAICSSRQSLGHILANPAGLFQAIKRQIQQAFFRAQHEVGYGADPARRRVELSRESNYSRSRPNASRMP